MDTRVDTIEARLAQLDARYNRFEEKLNRYEQQYRQFEIEVSRRLDEMYSRDNQEATQFRAQIRREFTNEIAQIRSELIQLNRMPTESSPYQSNSAQEFREINNGPSTQQNNAATVLPVNTENRPFKIKPRLPSFSGSPEEHPPQFIRSLNEFIRMAHIPPVQLNMVINQTLTGVAHEWWYLVATEVGSWEDFEKKFLARFWSSATQKKLRSTLEHGTFKENSNDTRVSYAMRLIGHARDLTPARDDEEIIQTLSRHFSQTIADSVINHNITSVEAFLALLDRWDHSHRVNKPQFSSNETRYLPRTSTPNNQNTYAKRPVQQNGRETSQQSSHPQTSFTRTTRNTPSLRATELVEMENNECEEALPEASGNE